MDKFLSIYVIIAVLSAGGLRAQFFLLNTKCRSLHVFTTRKFYTFIYFLNGKRSAYSFYMFESRVWQTPIVSSFEFEASKDSYSSGALIAYESNSMTFLISRSNPTIFLSFYLSQWLNSSYLIKISLISYTCPEIDAEQEQYIDCMDYTNSNFIHRF